MNIEELMAAATAKPGERIEMVIGRRVFGAVFYVGKASVTMDGKRVSVGVAKQGLIAEERATKETARRLDVAVIRTVDDLIGQARARGQCAVLLNGVKFQAIYNEGRTRLYVDGKSTTREKVYSSFESNFRIERRNHL